MPLTEGLAPSDIPDSEADDPDIRKTARYVQEVDAYERAARTWGERRKKILRRYKDERSPRENVQHRYNILWSMTKTLQPALLARTPKPDIQRRFKDDDPIGRVASDVLERCVSYFMEEDTFMQMAKQCVDDYLLPGRATCWVRYVPHFKPAQPMPANDPELQITDDEGEDSQTDEPLQEIDYEEVAVDFVHAEDFGHNVCRTWEEVFIVWRKVYLTRAELVKRFGEKQGNLPPLDYKMKSQTTDETVDTVNSKSVIFESWDKKSGYACWFHKEVPELLDIRKDPLGLEGFFPTVRPLYSTIANDSLIPVPDYIEWQDQAVQLDSLTSRIESVQRSLKVNGVYDASAQGVARLLAEGSDNELIPVENWAMFAEKGGIKGAVDFFPLEDVAKGLLAMFEAREKIKQDLYEITGIADIIRGQSDPNETMGAQQIKSNFATMRLSDRQADVQRFLRDVVRLMVDVIANHFQMETIKEMSGVRLFTREEKAALGAGRLAPAASGPAGTPPLPAAGPVAGTNGSPPSVPPQPLMPPTLPPGITQDQFEQMMADPTWEEVEALIRNKALRCFRIDIETNSTIKADEQQDKQDRVEFLKAAGGFLQQAVAAGAQSPDLVPLLGRMLMFGIRGFTIGKELESSFQSTIAKLEKEADNPQPKPNPEVMKIQGQMQLEQGKAQADQQIQQARVQGDMALAKYKADQDLHLEQARIQAKQASEQAEAQSSMQIDMQENELEARREQAKLEMEERLALAKIAAETDLQLKIAHIKAAASIEVARITAKLDSGEEAEAREASGE